MEEKLVLRPRLLLSLIIAGTFVAGVSLPFYIYSVNAFEKLECLLPLVLLFPSVIALSRLKTITINNQTWQVNYLLSRRKIEFSKSDVKSVKVKDQQLYTWAIPYTVYEIKLKSNKTIAYSSLEFSKTARSKPHFYRLK